MSEEPELTYNIRGTKLLSTGKFVPFIIPVENFKMADAFLIQATKEQLDLFQKIQDFPKLGGYIQHGRGISGSKEDFGDKQTKNPAYYGKRIQRYYALKPRYLTDDFLESKSKEKIQKLLRPKIVSQRIVAHIENPMDHIIIMSFYDKEGILNIETVENTFTYDYCPCGNCPRIRYEYILSLLNSRFISWYAYNFIFSKAIRTVDFDYYYISKIPIKIISEEEQEKFVEKTDQLTTLINEYHNIEISFNKYFFIESATTPKTFHTLYNEDLDSKYKETFDNITKGKIKKIIATQNKDDWIVISAIYEDNEKNSISKDICKFNLNNALFTDFFLIWFNNLEKNWGNGKIYDKILLLEIPRYDKDQTKNIEKIGRMLEPYLRDKSQKENLYDLIYNLNSEIDKEIYALFGLTEDEIKLVESETPDEVYLKKKE